MSTIVTRAGKGTPLTNNEVDANFTNLNNDKLEVEVNDLTTSVTWDNVPDAYITASSVTQHETALTITESQISDLKNYLTSYTETNDLSTAVTWDNVPDEYITESSVTQHESALTITESQISNLQSYLTSETSHADVLVDGDFTSAGFMKTNGNGGYSVDATTYLSNEIKDEDDMSSNSSTALATQQSIKAYVDAHTSPEVNDLTSSVTWANVPDANITQSSVTQHQSALSIQESQISDFGTYLTNEVKDEDDMASDSATALATQQSIKAYVDSQVSGGGAEVNDLSTTVTWANVPDAYITESSVTQHQAALSITENQISDLQSYLTTHQDISGKADLSGATFTGTLQVGQLGSGVSFNAYGNANLYSGANVVGNISVSGTVDGRDLATDGAKLDNIEANADVTDADNVTSAGAAMLASSPTFTGTVTAPNLDITHTGNASVTTNIATGGGTIGNTKVLNLGTGYGFGGTTTVNIGSSYPTSNNTINLNGDVNIDGNPYERTARLRFQKRGYSNTVAFLTLTTSYQQIGQALRLNDAINIDCENELELNMILNYLDIDSSNEGAFVVTVNAPAPAAETTVTLGTVITTTSTGSIFTFDVAGNVTKHMSPYCGMSVNSDGSSAFGFNNSDGWFYDPQTNRTTVECYAYQSNKPTTGDTVYLHPFDWESSGTEIFGDTYPLEAYNANGTVNQNQFYKIYLGYHEGGRYYRIKAREITASENLSISLVSGTYSQIIGS